MANYVVWHGKKRASFLRRDADLIRLLEHGGPAGHLLRAAVAVRDAQIRYLKSEYSRLDLGDGRNSAQLARLEVTIVELTVISAESIVAEYQVKMFSKESIESLTQVILMKLAIELQLEEDGRWIAGVTGLPGVMVYGLRDQGRGNFASQSSGNKSHRQSAETW